MSLARHQRDTGWRRRIFCFALIICLLGVREQMEGDAAKIAVKPRQWGDQNDGQQKCDNRFLAKDPILAGAATAADGRPEAGGAREADEFVILVERHLVFSVAIHFEYSRWTRPRFGR